MERDKEQLVERVLSLTERVYLAVRTVVPRQWLELDLSMAQLKILLLLFTGGPARMGDVASELEVSMATATGIVDRVVGRGLVVRMEDPRDRRVVVCQLSEAGEELMGRLWRLGQDRLRGILNRMAVPQLNLVARAMEGILETAPVERAEAPQASGVG